MIIRGNKIDNCGTGISVPETFTGEIENNHITNTKVAIEVRNKQVESFKEYIDSANELNSAEKDDLKKMADDLNSVDEPIETLSTKVKRKMTDYLTQIDKQVLIPFMIEGLKQVVSQITGTTGTTGT